MQPAVTFTSLGFNRRRTECFCLALRWGRRKVAAQFRRQAQQEPGTQITFVESGPLASSPKEGQNKTSKTNTGNISQCSWERRELVIASDQNLSQCWTGCLLFWGHMKNIRSSHTALPRVCPAQQAALVGTDKRERVLKKKLEDEAECPHTVLSGRTRGISRPEITPSDSCEEHGIIE